jgi:hypothetical protein
MSEDQVREKWPHELAQWSRDHAMADNATSRDALQIVFSHRKYKDEYWRFEFFCLRTNSTGWEDEEQLQLEDSAAVLTYWASSPGLRGEQSKEVPRVLRRKLRILEHKKDEDRLRVKVQYVGQPMLT